jgi:hypothetical protein
VPQQLNTRESNLNKMTRELLDRKGVLVFNQFDLSVLDLEDNAKHLRIYHWCSIIMTEFTGTCGPASLSLGKSTCEGLDGHLLPHGRITVWITTSSDLRTAHTGTIVIPPFPLPRAHGDRLSVQRKAAFTYGTVDPLPSSKVRLERPSYTEIVASTVQNLESDGG